MRVYLYLLLSGRTCNWLYALSTRITLHDDKFDLLRKFLIFPSLMGNALDSPVSLPSLADFLLIFIAKLSHKCLIMHEFSKHVLLFWKMNLECMTSQLTSIRAREPVPPANASNFVF